MDPKEGKTSQIKLKKLTFQIMWEKNIYIFKKTSKHIYSSPQNLEENL